MGRDARFRYSLAPKPPGSDNCSLTIVVRRVDGDPDGGPPLQRTSSVGIDLDTLLSDLRIMLAAIAASDQPDTGPLVALRSWAFHGLEGTVLIEEALI
ncbi:hypothetical protein [Methylobacterium sp. sgz302541]|uniref:hypothetical protein n=1 Tax=unclassified Methylobacterium TaxID=2615210 RepID=UPI003D3349D6